LYLEIREWSDPVSTETGLQLNATAAIGERGSPRYHASERTNGNRVTTLTRLLAVGDLLDLLVVPVKPDSREITQMVDRGPVRPNGLILQDVACQGDGTTLLP
jgi:hypothetical protein